MRPDHAENIRPGNIHAILLAEIDQELRPRLEVMMISVLRKSTVRP